jgi:DNA (cytosine-5)-methyltransferase 1
MRTRYAFLISNKNLLKKISVDSHTFRILSLCSGVGGIELGFKLAVPKSRTVGYIENEAFACAILAARMQDKILDDAPIWTDLKTFNGKPWRGKVDCLTGGYPCQPFSVAGRKLGDQDPRHLWPEIKRLITEIEPPICFFENVGGHLRLGFEQVANDLSNLGYKVKAGLFTAQETGAPHKRERLFILAYRCDIGCGRGSNNITKRYLQTNLDRKPSQNQQEWQGRITRVSPNSQNVANSEKFISKWNLPEGSRRQQPQEKTGGRNSELGDSTSKRLEGWQCQESNTDQLYTWPPSPTSYDEWGRIPNNLKPAIHKLADGMANRVDEIRASGNGVVPLVCAYAWRVLTDGMCLVKDRR